MSESAFIFNDAKLQRVRRTDAKFDGLSDLKRAHRFVLRAREIAVKINDELRRVEDLGDLSFNDVAYLKSIDIEFHDLNV